MMHLMDGLLPECNNNFLRTLWKRIGNNKFRSNERAFTFILQKILLNLLLFNMLLKYVHV